ncbi:MAG TPA: protein phosphatase 2C domain-containing protein [Acetobacteraceae bacterium]|nr:protein phosphatase 2C domain-containing protein [Acetobacteraceae bacterium]
MRRSPNAAQRAYLQGLTAALASAPPPPAPMTSFAASFDPATPSHVGSVPAAASVRVVVPAPAVTPAATPAGVAVPAPVFTPLAAPAARVESWTLRPQPYASQLWDRVCHWLKDRLLRLLVLGCLAVLPRPDAAWATGTHVSMHIPLPPPPPPAEASGQDAATPPAPADAPADATVVPASEQPGKAAGAPGAKQPGDAVVVPGGEQPSEAATVIGTRPPGHAATIQRAGQPTRGASRVAQTPSDTAHVPDREQPSGATITPADASPASEAAAAPLPSAPVTSDATSPKTSQAARRETAASAPSVTRTVRVTPEPSATQQPLPPTRDAFWSHAGIWLALAMLGAAYAAVLPALGVLLYFRSRASQATNTTAVPGPSIIQHAATFNSPDEAAYAEAPTASVVRPPPPVEEATAAVVRPTAPVEEATAPVAEPIEPIAQPAASATEPRAQVGQPTAPPAQPQTPATAPWPIGFATNRGQVRHRNEDAGAAFCLGDHQIAIVADGLGGMPLGAEASAIAVRAAERSLRRGWRSTPHGQRPHPSMLLQLAVAAAMVRLAAHGLRQGFHTAREGLRTTLIVVIATADRYHFAYIGDGGIFVVRANGTVDPLMTPHKVEGGALNELAASLGPFPHGAPVFGDAPRQPGDLLAAATDGVADRLQPAFYSHTLVRHARRSDGDFSAAAARVLTILANYMEGEMFRFDDNMTLALIGDDQLPASDTDTARRTTARAPETA